MLLDTSDSLVQIKITESVCVFVAICTTVHRLYIRWKRGGLWTDDAWVAFALLCSFVQIAAVFMHVKNPASLSKLSRVAAYYLMAITFYCIIWASRISIIYSIIRIDPNVYRRKLYIGVSVAYFITAIVLIIQLFWVCEPEPQWKDADSPQCELNKQVAVCQLVTDILADMFLLFAPLRVLIRLQDRTLRKKLVVIFSTCIITTIVSLVHAAYILTVGGIPVVISALVEDNVSLIIANIPVVVTAILRFTSSDSSEVISSTHEEYPRRAGRGHGDEGLISTVLKFRSRARRGVDRTRNGPDGVSIGLDSDAGGLSLGTRKFGNDDGAVEGGYVEDDAPSGVKSAQAHNRVKSEGGKTIVLDLIQNADQAGETSCGARKHSPGSV